MSRSSPEFLFGVLFGSMKFSPGCLAFHERLLEAVALRVRVRVRLAVRLRVLVLARDNPATL